MFANLKHLQFTVDGAHWLDVTDFLRPLPAHLRTLVIPSQYKAEAMDKDLLVKEDGEVKAMRINGLEHLDPVLSRDNFKNLSYLQFERWGYSGVLPPLRESMLQSIQQKLPKLRGRSGLPVDIQPNSESAVGVLRRPRLLQFIGKPSGGIGCVISRYDVIPFSFRQQNSSDLSFALLS